MRLFHFATKEWLDKLMKDGKVTYTPTHEYGKQNGRDVPYSILCKHLNYEGIVFFWNNLSMVKKFKGDFNLGKGDYILLYLDVPDKYITRTDYYEWCEFIEHFVDAESCKDVFSSINEYSDKSFKELFDKSFIDKNSTCLLQQILAPYCLKEWIVSAVAVDEYIY